MENHYKKMKQKYGYAYQTPDELKKRRELLKGKTPTEEEQSMVDAFFKLIKPVIKCLNCGATFKENVKICEVCGAELSS